MLYKLNPTTLEEVVQVSPFKSITIIGDHSTLLVKERNQSYIFRLRLNYYPSYRVPNEQNSGTYIFRPQNQSLNVSSSYATPGDTAVFNGKVVTQISLYSDKAIQFYQSGEQGI